MTVPRIFLVTELDPTMTTPLPDDADIVYAEDANAVEYRSEIDEILEVTGAPPAIFVSDESSLGDFAPYEGAERTAFFDHCRRRLDDHYGIAIDIDSITPLWMIAARIRRHRTGMAGPGIH